MRRLIAGAILLVLLVAPVRTIQAQTPEPPLAVRQLLNTLTPEERVGQLFLVTFTGTDVSETSDIFDLITNHHIGGVVLLAENDNFTDSPATTQDAYTLITNLQDTELRGSKVQVLDTETGRFISPAYIPLWVGISQEGNGFPTDQVFNGMTSLPSEMALGATWDSSLAEQVGEVAGRELSALGFNLLMGPSLDVLDQPYSTSNSDLGTRVFGGDPYWVGEMGRAYIAGLHSGSGNRLLVISKHFPGRGSSDRPPEFEVATVRKSLEQLKQIELAPFIAVTGNAPNSGSTTDGLLVSHIRYQGFQGNIRATTRPVSFDSQALGEILKLTQFSLWWENGGLIVSDDLGSRAVRDFYAPGDSQFNPRLIVRDAFLAGNDLLFLSDIYTAVASDHRETILQILEYFTQRYMEDAAFAQRVDEAVTRILARKVGMYGPFPEAGVTRDISQLNILGNSNQVSFQVARQAVTLVSPERQDLDSILPEPPSSDEYLVFLTDSSSATQCSTCEEQPVLAADALQQAILRLYGPTTGGQVLFNHLVSYSFVDLSNLLGSAGNDVLESDLGRADWVIISMTDAALAQPQLVHRFLAERQDLLRAKKIILFSFGAPYYFDSTDIAKLSAYFVLYSKSSAFIDVAARVLYKELPADGHSPVSIPGIGYELINITSPDPGQVISLDLDRPVEGTSTAEPSITPEPTTIPQFFMGDTVTVRTGTILDHNGNPVPDGTVVRFNISVGGEGGGTFQQTDATTVNGSASITFRIDKQGLVEIRASSEPAIVSAVLQLDVKEGAPAVVTVIVPELSETVMPNPVTPVPAQENDFVTTDGSPRFGGWMLSMLLVTGGSLLAYWLGGSWGKPRWSLRWALCALLGGLIVYNYLALGLPGAAAALITGGGGALIGMTLLGELAGVLGAWLWMRKR